MKQLGGPQEASMTLTNLRECDHLLPKEAGHRPFIGS